MKYTLVLFTALLYAFQASCLKLLLPLYIYPDDSASAWSNVTAAIAAYPQVQWLVILTLGYVDTAYPSRSYSSVVSDIKVYAKWASYPSATANISIGGIFFDDVSGPAAATKDIVTYYHNVSTYAYAKVPSIVTPVVFNPGSLGPQKLFQYCDFMVEFESQTSDYHNDTTINTLPRGSLGQSALIIYNATASTDVKGLVHTMAADGIGAVYFDYGSCTYQGSPTGCYNQYGLVALEGLAAAVLAG